MQLLDLFVASYIDQEELDISKQSKMSYKSKQLEATTREHDRDARILVAVETVSDAVSTTCLAPLWKLNFGNLALTSVQ
jgi:hypothetical protein